MCAKSAELFELVITLGEDSTVLFASWFFRRIVPPIIPVALDESNHALHLYRLLAQRSFNNTARCPVGIDRCDFHENSWQRHSVVAHIPRNLFQVLNKLAVDCSPSTYASLLELFAGPRTSHENRSI
ncbi:hypothetical protein PCANC_13483 [Puccinia coronata f. sp. avenae]|uniref:Uncharacterized protein n=1 Tax=Puccinia coronata f. sp. avenae TaxID=200324 RepID=A0A2N5V4M0_9BASI|nr:hypothetical protein PCANC_13483 [Puccinia coronata f. sp. avenae]